jgi:Pro-kumamolisin, activation domain
VNVTVEEAESLLRTQYHVYTNVQTGKDHLACDDYSVPLHIKEHIDFITPTIHFGRSDFALEFAISWSRIRARLFKLCPGKLAASELLKHALKIPY